MFVFFTSQIGCGPKTSDVLKKYEGDFQKKREQFQSIAHSLPPKGSPVAPCTSISPPIQFNEKTKQFNTEMVMFDQLLDPDAKPKFDFYMNGELLNGIQWTGPKNPLSPSVLGKPGKDMEKGMKDALDDHYLVVNRIAEFTEPTAIDEKTFSPGQIKIETFLIDLSNNKLLCNFVIEGKTTTNVSYSFKQGESQQEQLEKFAHSTLWDEARQQLITRLKEMPNSNVELE